MDADEIHEEEQAAWLQERIDNELEDMERYDDE